MLTLLLTPDETAVRNLGTEGAQPLPRISIETLEVGVAILDCISNPTGTRLWEPRDITGWDIKVAVGLPYLAPLGGTYDFTAFPNTTYGIDPTLGLTELVNEFADNDIQPITVTEISENYYKLTWNAPGVHILSTTDPAELYPPSVAEVKMLHEGSADNVTVQTLRILQLPAASATLATLEDDVTPTVTVLQEGGSGVNERVRIVFDPVPYDGGFIVTVDGQEGPMIAHNATADEMRVGMEQNTEVGEGNISVIKEGDGRYLLAFQGTKSGVAIGTIAVETDSLRAIPTMTGELNTDTVAMENILGESLSVEVYLEVTATPPGGDEQKIYRGPITVVSPILRPTIV